MNEIKPTAKEALWHLSKYNLSAKIPGTDRTAVVNLFKGVCSSFTPAELYLLSVLDSLPEDHPVIERFEKRGVIVRFDEEKVLETMGRIVCSSNTSVGLVICPTLGCNFDCPYCFENHKAGAMTEKTQEEIVGLAKHMLEVSGAKALSVTWFGGEPLLFPDIIESLSEKLIAMTETMGVSYDAWIITNGYLLTEKNAKLLERCKVTYAQITLDGLEEAHDKTRHLAGGGGTFRTITENLRTQKLSFQVDIRHNVHDANLDQVEPLRTYVRNLARESGNEIRFYPAPVDQNPVSEELGRPINLLYGSSCEEVSILNGIEKFSTGRGHFCGAQYLFGVCIDEQGRLYKCWEDVDKPEKSFGCAKNWKADDAFYSAERPDILTSYLNTALPLSDDECRECVWLPICIGGCPNRRLEGEKQCLPYRREPEKLVLALYKQMKERKENYD